MVKADSLAHAASALTVGWGWRCNFLQSLTYNFQNPPANGKRAATLNPHNSGVLEPLIGFRKKNSFGYW
jgi:hypothetical protein